LSDPALLGAALGPIETWRLWLIVLRAAFGEVLSAEELEHFARVAGNRPLPGRRVRELWCVIGRRGGKSRIAAAIAAYLALFIDHSAYLAPGETGFVLTLSMSRDQAQGVHDYILAFIEQSPVLRQEIVNVNQSEIGLRNRITIATHTNSFRTVRGRTIVACVFDEVALWRDETTATPDIETYRAVLPSMFHALDF
jgi:phage terminase large subunit-like protein